MEIEVTGTRGEKGDKGDKGDRGISNKLQNWHVLLGIGMICFSILSGAVYLGKDHQSIVDRLTVLEKNQHSVMENQAAMAKKIDLLLYIHNIDPDTMTPRFIITPENGAIVDKERKLQRTEIARK
jgi:hypothetical protein